MYIFEIIDKSGRQIRLSKERWAHIRMEHPEITDYEEIIAALANPLKINSSFYNPDSIKWYYKFDKKKNRYLMVAVKYLNGEGFVITSYYMRNIK